MGVDRSVTFTGIQFENPFLLSSAPPTESESNIMRAFEAGWGGVVTKTIGLHPVVNVYGAKAKFMRTGTEDANVSMKKRPGAALHSSWNWELISDKTLEWWAPRIRRLKEAFPNKVLIASIMAGSGNDKELRHWQELAETAQGEGADGLELNFSCPHMDRRDMGSNIGKDQGLCSVVTEAVKEVAKVPVWCKLTPATADIVVEAAACFRGGADAIVSSNTFPSLASSRSTSPSSSRAADWGDQRFSRSRWRRCRNLQRRFRIEAFRELGACLISIRRPLTFCSGAEPFRCARPQCSIRRSVQTSSSACSRVSTSSSRRTRRMGGRASKISAASVATESWPSRRFVVPIQQTTTPATKRWKATPRRSPKSRCGPRP